MCVCDKIGTSVMMGSAETSESNKQAVFLDLAILRRDRWDACLQAFTIGYHVPHLAVDVPINYCPMCGKRLALADAGRRENESVARN